MIKELGDLKIEVSVVDVHAMNSIPKFIDRVPMLLIDDQQVIHDEELFEFMKKNEKTVEPFMINEMQGLSDNYSFMDDTELDHVYSFLDKHTNLITDTGGSKQEENSKILNYDKYIEERDAEIQGILTQQSPVSAR
tara:strand:+ start:8228 stop:8635 length:408 start_codon:yes stop_codon:yes gene_type:complete